MTLNNDIIVLFQDNYKAWLHCQKHNKKLSIPRPGLKSQQNH